MIGLQCCSQTNQDSILDNPMAALRSTDGEVNGIVRPVFWKMTALEVDQWWIGISLQHKTQVEYKPTTLTRWNSPLVVTPFILAHPQMILMQDNATSRSARATRHQMASYGVQVMDLPLRFPDLNPIKHLWICEIKTFLWNFPQTVAALRQERQWNLLAQPEIRQYIASIRRRCEVVIEAEGGHTRY